LISAFDTPLGVTRGAKNESEKKDMKTFVKFMKNIFIFEIPNVVIKNLEEKEGQHDIRRMIKNQNFEKCNCWPAGCL
jgi:rRNA-processing protein FCF1